MAYDIFSGSDSVAAAPAVSSSGSFNIFSGKVAAPAPAKSTAPGTAPISTAAPAPNFETLTGQQQYKAPPTKAAVAAAFAPPAGAKGPIVTGTGQASLNPYFSAVDKTGNSYGFSDQKDSSGKPYFAYRAPGDTATTTDTTRVATTFDPRVAQVISPSVIQNGRMPENVSGPIKKALGGTYSTELDHSIALELSGSNHPTNLKIETGRLNGGKSATFDTQENALAHLVATGQMSLWDAQTKLATEKNAAGDKNPIPFTGKVPTVDTSSMFSKFFKDNSAAGVAKNTVMGFQTAGDTVAKYIYDTAMSIVLPGATPDEINNPKFLATKVAPEVIPSVEKIGKQIIQHPIVSAAQVGQGTTLGVLNFLSSAIVNYIPGLVPAQEKAGTIAALNDTFQKELFPEGQNDIGSGFQTAGEAVIPILASAGAGGIAAKLGAGEIGQFAAGTAGFAATGQSQLPSNATIAERAQNVLDSLVQQGIFTAGSYAYHITKGMVTTGAKSAYQAAANKPTDIQENAKPLHNEVNSVIAQHGEPVAQQALQEKGATTAEATQIIQGAKASMTPEERAASLPKAPVNNEPFTTTDIQGNNVEQQFIRPATDLESKSPTAKTRGYDSIVPKKGYETVFKPYGEKGAGYYYSKVAPTVEEAGPAYFDKVIKDSVASGETTNIDADTLKASMGVTETADHAPFAKEAQKAYTQALKENPSPNVYLTIGGPGTGKTEVLGHSLQDRGGVMFQGTGANYERSIANFNEAKQAGKTPIFVSNVVNPEDAWAFAKGRETAGGHATDKDYFIKRSNQAIETRKRIIEEGYPVALKDIRGIKNVETARAVPLITDPKEQLALSGKVVYDESHVSTDSTGKGVIAESNQRQNVPSKVRGGSSKLEENGGIGGKETHTVKPSEEKVSTLTIDGKEVPLPDKLVNKTDLKNLVATFPDGEATFTVGEDKQLEFKTPTSEGKLKPSALGLSDVNLKPGDTVKINLEDLKAKGTNFRMFDNNNFQSGKIDLHLDTFFDKDVYPAFKGSVEGVAKTLDIIKKTFNPSARGEEAIKTASIMRESLGKMAHTKEVVYQALGEAHKTFDAYSNDESLAFIDKFETGKPIAGAEKFVAIMREALGSRWAKIQEIKGIDAYIENYFPHIWKDPIKASEKLTGFGKRPLEGTKKYMKERTIPTTREGIALGLEPESYNPVDLIMARVADMDRFLMANDVWTQFKEQGLRKFVATGGEVPTGWIKVNDKISTSFQFSAKEKGLILRGSWYMPEQAATVVNNYLSPGLTNNPIYNAARMLGNTLNQVQLGFSGYHALFTSADAVISKAALELQKGTVTGVVKAATSPVLAPYYLWKNITRGNALLTDYFAKNPQVPLLVDALERAGGRVKVDSFYHNSAMENFMKAIRGNNPLGALIRAPGAAIEALAKPIMQELVPRQKLGVFADGATHILEQAQKEGWSEYKTTLRLQEMWDSVDNRMGQLVYDNLFWNKVTKDLGMVATRSLGWNLGTIRELGGGVKGFAKIPEQLIRGQKADIRLTPKMAYTVTLPYIVGMWGAAIFYLYNHKAPETALDYFYPRTGKLKPDGTPERISLPSYMKDVFAYQAEGSQTAINKLHPEVSAIIAMLQNKDYYGTEIRNPNDPLVTQMEDLAKYQANQYIPFTITNLLQRQKTGGSWPEYLQSFAGITPAPAYITRTPMQTNIYNMYDKRFGGTTQSQDQTAISKQKSEVRSLYLQGKIDEANKGLDTLVALGIVKDKTLFVKDADIPNDVKLFARLAADDQTTLIKQMSLVELNKYAWSANNALKAQFSILSANTKMWVELEKAGDVKQPVWKKGQDTNIVTP